MAIGRAGRSLMGPLLIVNFVVYLILLGLAGWSLDKYINGQQNHPHLGGNEATSFMLTFALLGGVVGACSVLAALMHLRAWSSDSLSSASSSAIISWAITVVAFGTCMQGDHNGRTQRKEIANIGSTYRDINIESAAVFVALARWHVQQQMKLLAQQRDLQGKIPDIEKCLDIVTTLQAKKGTGEALLADFEVSEGIYSQARIQDTDSVCLWLGANVMLEYSCEEATKLLQMNLENARASLEVIVADLQFLRDQVTFTQVTIARIYNWD
ncbi:unnamed protein product [Camellia sinensis]